MIVYFAEYLKWKENDYLYDDKADFLEINTGKYVKGYFRDISKGIYKRIRWRNRNSYRNSNYELQKRIVKIKDLKLALPVEIEIFS